MQNNFFTPEEIQHHSPNKKSPFLITTQKLNFNYKQTYDIDVILQQDLFRIVKPHVESLSDQKKKIISWLKKLPYYHRLHVLTYTNKQFVCLLRTMYQKKQTQFQPHSANTFNITYIDKNNEFSLIPIFSNKNLPKKYLDAQDVRKTLFQKLLQSIRIMSRYTQFDSITFNEEMLRDIESIFTLFDVIDDEISHELTEEDYFRLKKLPSSAMFYHEQSYRKTIGIWITQTLMNHISMKYFEYQLQSQLQLFEDLKTRARDFENYWKIMTLQNKHQLMKKIFQLKAKQLCQQNRQMIKVSPTGYPSIQKNNFIDKYLRSIIKLNEKDIFYLLFFTQISQTLQIHTFYKYYIILELEEQIRKYNQLQQLVKKNQIKHKKQKKKKKKHLQAIQTSQSAQNFEKKKQKQQYSANNQNNDNIISENEKQSKTGNTCFQPKQKQKAQFLEGINLFYKKLEISDTQCIISFSGPQEKLQQKQQSQKNQQQQTIIDQTPKEIKNKKKSKKKGKKKNKQKFHEKQSQEHEQQDCIIQAKKQSIFIGQNEDNFTQNCPKRISHSTEKSSETTADHQLDSQDEIINEKQFVTLSKKNKNILSELYQEIEKKTTFYNKQRKIIINRLNFIFSQHNLSFKLYGSTACNTALPNSDIDVVVDPSIVNYFYFSFCNYRKKIINSLQYLQKVFQKYNWISDFVLIPGATIPILTFNANSNMPFQIDEKNFLLNNKRKLKEDIKIAVDITIESYVNMTDEIPMHLGIQSTQLINEWISTYPFYKELFMLLKLLIKNHNLNKIYHGGISSYMQAVLLTAFYKQYLVDLGVNFAETQPKKEKFQDFLTEQNNTLINWFKQYSLFIQKIQTEKEMININASRSICEKSQKYEAQKLSIINPLTEKVMSERFTLFPQYREIIMKVYDILITTNKTKHKDLQAYFKL